MQQFKGFISHAKADVEDVEVAELWAVVPTPSNQLGESAQGPFELRLGAC